MIKLLDKVDLVVDDVAEKVSSLDGLFNAINKTTYGISAITDKINYTVINFFSKIFKRKKNRKEEL